MWTYAIVVKNNQLKRIEFLQSNTLSNSNGVCIYMQNKQVYCLFNLTMPLSEFAFCFDAQYTIFGYDAQLYGRGVSRQMPPTIKNSSVSTFNLQPVDPPPLPPNISSIAATALPPQPCNYHNWEMSETNLSSSEQSSISINGSFTSSFKSGSSSFFSTMTRTNIDGEAFIKPPMATSSEPEYELPTLKEIKTFVNEAQGLTEVKCALCHEVSTKAKYCEKCDKCYCHQCAKFAHARIGHEHDESVQARQKVEEEPKCAMHPGNKLTLYCIEDEMICCEQCFRSGHAGHNALGLEEAVRIIQANLEKHMEALEKEVGDTRTAKKVDELTKKIAKKEKKIRKLIDKREKSMFEEIDKMFVSEQAEANMVAATTSSSPSSVGGLAELSLQLCGDEPPVTELEVRKNKETLAVSARAHNSKYNVTFDENFEGVIQEISEFGEVIKKEAKK